jgi:hypothetical protein
VKYFAKFLYLCISKLYISKSAYFRLLKTIERKVEKDLLIDVHAQHNQTRQKSLV